jgi:hypothetical protein
LLTNIITRGYSTMLFHRMIKEDHSLSPKTFPAIGRAEMQKSQRCAAIFLEGKPSNIIPPFTDMPEYLNAYVLGPNGEVRSIPAPLVAPNSEGLSRYVRLFSFRASNATE